LNSPAMADLDHIAMPVRRRKLVRPRIYSGKTLLLAGDSVATIAKTTMPQKPMFLPGVEQNPQPGPHRDFLRAAQAAGAEYPQIWHLFAYRPQATGHLALFTQEIMRGDAPISPGIRELIAAYTSYQNDCPF
jgi:hypothetical protein